MDFSKLLRTSALFYTTSEDAMRDNTRYELLQNFHALTRGQRFADWLLLRRFRVTSTVASKVLLHDNGIRNELGLSISDTIATSQQQLMNRLFDVLFSQQCIIELMMRVSANEYCVQKVLRELSFVKRIYDIWLMCDKERGRLVCSFGLIVLLDLKNWKRRLYTEKKQSQMMKSSPTALHWKSEQYFLLEV